MRRHPDMMQRILDVPPTPLPIERDGRPRPAQRIVGDPCADTVLARPAQQRMT